MIKKHLLALLLLPLSFAAQENDKFRQLEELLPTPNTYRTASGAPGHEYWQQQADYNINVTLDDNKQSISGEEVITYHNNSPDALNYLWLQLDQNLFAKESDTRKIRSNNISEDKMNFDDLELLHSNFDGGYKILSVKDASGKALHYTINKTMMRVDLPQTLKAGGSYSFSVKWWYNINDRMKLGGRSGYEYFEADKNYIYTIAQFFPRLCVYSDNTGWQNKQFLGMGEFTLPFGNYKVNITVPSDHIVSATGELQNAASVLSSKQQERMKQARNSFDKPQLVVTPEEAKELEKSKSATQKTWTFAAKNVRDFAFASSRKFIWDAMAVNIGGKNIMAMSFYPNEANPLWGQYSTKVVAHTLRVYSKYTINYPYPVAQSVHSADIGMEYPMICFNLGRPEKDGTYSEQTKIRMISVIVHEVGHNFFPMIINSDERQWTWMDEGLNTFTQYLAEQEWDRNYPSRRGPASTIVDYMRGEKGSQVPIMTNSESIKQFGNNAYGKPACALNILRETVMGRELFDYAFKEYARRWAFKHPSPADFFRTMEDASAVDLDWFWRGWFYGTDPVDISIDEVIPFRINTRDPEVEKNIARLEKENEPRNISAIRNKETIPQTVTEKDPDAKDFYDRYNPYEVTPLDSKEFNEYYASLNEEQKSLLKEGHHYYEVHFSNKGGLVSPIILQFEFTDGSSEMQHIPAEIWKMGNDKVSKVFFFKKEVKNIALDPFLETADIDTGNNHWPAQPKANRFRLYKEKEYSPENPMQKQKRIEEMQKDQNR